MKKWGVSGERVLGVSVVVREREGERESRVIGVSERVWWESGVKEWAVRVE